jgi:DNA-directed RNA polymerase subunit D
MAIDSVEIQKNDSALYDEILAHRLGLIPLKTDFETYNLSEKCTCKNEGCAKCQTNLTIDIKGPKTVYSSDLIPKDPEIIPVINNLPIVILTGEQEIKLIATAKLGKGKNHMKFSPGLVIYKNKPILKINNNSKIIEKYKNLIPKKALKDGKLDEKSILENNLYEAIESISQDLIKINYEEDKFIFTIESFGQLDPREMINGAIKEFDDKLDEFTNKLGSSKKIISKLLKK